MKTQVAFCIVLSVLAGVLASSCATVNVDRQRCHFVKSMGMMMCEQDGRLPIDTE